MTQPHVQWLHKEAQAGSFTVDLLETRSDAYVPFHVHDEVTIGVPLRGSVAENTEKKGAVGRPGVVFIERPDTPHENIYDEGGAMVLRLILSVELERFFDLEAETQADNARCYEIASSMAMSMDRADPLMLECAGLEVMGCLSNGPDWSPRSHPPYLRDIVADLRAHRIPARGISAIAKEAQVSPTRLVRAFRRSYGISFARFVRVLQMQRAFALLSDPATSISAVAADAGFSDQSHMTRIFVQTYGMPPARLRGNTPQRLSARNGITVA